MTRGIGTGIESGMMWDIWMVVRAPQPQTRTMLCWPGCKRDFLNGGAAPTDSQDGALGGLCFGFCLNREITSPFADLDSFSSDCFAAKGPPPSLPLRPFSEVGRPSTYTSEGRSLRRADPAFWNWLTALAAGS